MALSIHTNYAALVTQTSLNKFNNALTTTQQRLGTGLRINSAADDAAGLQIAARLNAQARGMSVAMRNVSDGISLLQTAEGAFNEMTGIVLRMKDLATQAANGTNSDADRQSLQNEYDDLGRELANILGNTTYAGERLFAGADTTGTIVINGDLGKFGADPDGNGSTPAGVVFQIGGTSAEKMTLDVSGQLESLIDGLTGISTVFSALATDPTSTTAGSEISTTASNAVNAQIDKINNVLDTIGQLRAKFGATINRLNHTNNNLSNMRDNTEMAKGRIMDADFAMESANLSKNSMLLQSGISMLKQASQMPSLVMGLLG